MKIIPIEPSRFEGAADVIRRSFATVAKDFGLTKENCPTNPAFLEADWLRRDHDAGAEFFGLYIGGALSGVVGLKPKENVAFEMTRLAVLPEHRHQGCGRALVDFACKTAKERGAEKMTIGIIFENLELKKWYGAYGFVETDRKEFPHLPFTVSFMEKEFTDMENGVQVISLKQKASLITKLHDYKAVAEMNGYYFKLVKMQREFIWHRHPETDETFYCVEGEFDIHLRDKILHLSEGDLAVIPKGVEHKPVSVKQSTILMIEPKETVNTGDAGGDLTDDKVEWI